MTETTSLATIGVRAAAGARGAPADAQLRLARAPGPPDAVRRDPRAGRSGARALGRSRRWESSRCAARRSRAAYFKARPSADGLHRRRVVPDRRHRHDRRAGLRRDPRSLEGSDQVGRRVDQLRRARERADGTIPPWPKPRWSRCRTRSGDERPLACVVLKPGAAATATDLRAAPGARLSPSGGCRMRSSSSTQIPRTSTGKFLKSALRARYGTRANA